MKFAIPIAMVLSALFGTYVGERGRDQSVALRSLELELVSAGYTCAKVAKPHDECLSDVALILDGK